MFLFEELAGFGPLTMVVDKPQEALATLRASEGKDIWLFGGGSLLRSLLDAGLVDTVEVSVMPVLLGGGVFAPPTGRRNLKLTGHKIHKNGIVSLDYGLVR
jgi:dihydrofolate reductase